MSTLSSLVTIALYAASLASSSPVRLVSETSPDFQARSEPSFALAIGHHRTPRRVFGARHRHIRDTNFVNTPQGQVPAAAPPNDGPPTTTIFWAFGDSEPRPSDFPAVSANIVSPMSSALGSPFEPITMHIPSADNTAAMAAPSPSLVVGQSSQHSDAGMDAGQAARRAVILHVLGFLGLAVVGVLLAVIWCKIMISSGRWTWGSRERSPVSRSRPEDGIPILENSEKDEQGRARKKTWSSRLSSNLNFGNGFPFQNYRTNARRYDDQGIEKIPHYLPSHLTRSAKKVAFEDDQVLNIAGVGLGQGLTSSHEGNGLPTLSYRITTPSPIYQPGRMQTHKKPVYPSADAKHLSLSTTTNSTNSYSSQSSSSPSDISDESMPLGNLMRASSAKGVVVIQDKFRPLSCMTSANVEPLRPKNGRSRSITFAPGTVGERKSGKSVQSTASSEWDIARAYRYDQSRSGVSTVSGISGMSRISDGEGTEFESRIMAMRANARSSC
ncbi:hypothetical protein HWV62_6705 [Athelia sp. TMB]|nr:hypothetical protein HWV62_22748 [Athelia sp. TMB]KAF7976456.1 hypothetical protein HWV62_6705 [Athelia sp. TMB]